MKERLRDLPNFSESSAYQNKIISDEIQIEISKEVF